MTDEKLRQLRKRIASTPVNRRGRRQYDEVLRQEIASYAARRYARGESYAKIAEALKLPSATLLHWRDKAARQPKAKKRQMGFRPIRLRAEEPRRLQELDAKRVVEKSQSGVAGPASQPIVVLPGGVRIEGVAVGELAEFVRSMGCLR